MHKSNILLQKLSYWKRNHWLLTWKNGPRRQDSTETVAITEQWTTGVTNTLLRTLLQHDSWLAGFPTSQGLCPHRAAWIAFHCHCLCQSGSAIPAKGNTGREKNSLQQHCSCHWRTMDPPRGGCPISPITPWSTCRCIPCYELHRSTTNEMSLTRVVSGRIPLSLSQPTQTLRVPSQIFPQTNHQSGATKGLHRRNSHLGCSQVRWLKDERIVSSRHALCR